MKHRPGFTIVEVIVVITAIAILAGIGTVTYTGLQRQAREDERIADMDVVASYMESYYEQHGSYISVMNFYYGTFWGHDNPYPLTEGIPTTALTSPTDSDATAPLYSFPAKADITDSMSNSSFATLPSSGNFDYVYMPYSATGEPCTMQAATGPCTRFSLYYKDEQGVIKEMKSKYGN